MLHAIIMAGGSGTRLWPESRQDRPKQLLRIQGDRTLVQATVERLGSLIPLERVLVVTAAALADKVREQLAMLPRDAVLAEPVPRNTAPCIGLAAVRVLNDDPEAVMVVMPADHAIGPDTVFQEAIAHAQALVEEDPSRLVTFGIPPTYASMSFGYIERGQRLASPAARRAGAAAAYQVKRFREKPALDVARQYLEAGTFSWNAGIFVWKARTILDCLARYEPAMHGHLLAIAEAAGTPRFEQTLDEHFAAMDAIAVDYAVMERAANVVLIEAPFHWDDVGGWRALERLRPLDELGNVIDAAEHLEIDTERCIVRSGDKEHLVVLVGVKNLMVVVTPDATLVAHKDDEEAIRRVTQELARRGLTQYL